MGPKVVVVGSLNMDLVTRVREHPQIGETIFASGQEYLPGGKGANQAIACSRFGAPVHMVGRIGDDAFGRQLLELQTHEKIDVSRIRVVDCVPSGVAVITLAEDSSNSIIVNAGANAQWEEGAFEDLDLSSSDILLTQLEVPENVVMVALKKAREAGAMCVLNPSPIEHFRQEMIGLLDLLILNEIELEKITGIESVTNDTGWIEAASTQIAEQGCPLIVTTRGRHGVCVWADGRSQQLDGHTVDAVDTTGAGDCFAGVLTAELLAGKDLVSAATVANHAASFSVTQKGASTSMPTREILDEQR